MASYTTNHPYSNTALNRSSISLAHSHTSTSNDPEPVQDSHLHKPIRPTKSRLRPALPASFLQIPSSDSTSQPWKLRSHSSSESLPSRSATPRDQVLLRDLSDSVQYLSDSSSFKSNSPGIEAGLSAKVPDMNRFSTCFVDGSSVSLLDPQMMQIDERRKGSVLHEKTRCISMNSGDSGCYLTDLKLSISGTAPTTPVTSKLLPSAPRSATRTTPFRSASACSVYRADSNQSIHDNEMEILHIRLPKKERSSFESIYDSRKRSLSSSNLPKRNDLDSKNQRQAQKAAKIAEANLRIRVDDPFAKDALTTIDGLFGTGKEESKARRCGYGGLGIAENKRTWKATDDYQSLLRGTVRSSIYNITPRSPRPTTKRKMSIPSSSPLKAPKSPLWCSSPKTNGFVGKEARIRKAPPPPLDLTAVSSFSTSLATIKTAHRKAIGKVEKRPLPLSKKDNGACYMEVDDGTEPEMHIKTARRVTFNAFLRTVKSITSLRSNRS